MPTAVNLARLRIAALSLMCVFLTVLPFSSSVALRNIALVAGGAAALAWIAGTRRESRDRLPPGRVLIPLACWWFWCAASVAWSVDPGYTLSELRPSLLPGIAGFLLFHAMTVDYTDLDRWAAALTVGLAALAAVAIGQHLYAGRWDPLRWHVDTGYYTTHLVLAAPLVVWLWLRSAGRSTWLRPAIAVTVVGTLLVAYWAENRMMWIALAAMAITAAFLRQPAERRAAVILAAAATAACAAFFVAAHVHRGEALASRGVQAADFGADPRLSIWPHAIERIGQAPWLGHGYGRGILRHDMRASGEGGGNSLHWHAHNIFLNVVLQVGLVGLALFVWTWAAIVRTLSSALAEASPRRWSAVLGLALIVGYTAKNMTDDFHVRHIALLVWSLAGALVALAPPRREEREATLASAG